ncbi:MAG: VWA domain-containing protein [Desulfobacteraceae bacterium]|jgi:Ca-activated chloride channel family protein
MKPTRLKSFVLIIILIAATGAAMAYSTGAGKSWLSGLIAHPGQNTPSIGPGPVTLNGRLVQHKVLQGSDGRVNLALTLQADERFDPQSDDTRNVDMVIVLDRSGSMKGRKINDARQAVLQLLSGLTAKDRFALVTYSDRVQQISGLKHVTADHGKQLKMLVNGIIAGGGTNLGDGLQTGIDVILAAPENGNAKKLVLISDGLANKGITDSTRLGQMAAVAVEQEFAISTVGVGNDFNEQLMTTIADHGAGNYYYLENPMAFAEVFQKEFFYTRATVATNVSISFSLGSGISIADAAGYPLTVQKDRAVFYPGDLRAGQSRKLFLTLQVPTGATGSFELGRIKAHYRFNGQPIETALEGSYKIACIKDQREVQASIDKTAWAEKVIREDYNRLKQEVAADIKAGKKQKALRRIHSYYREQESINTAVGSAEVTQNLDRDLKDLQQKVEETFKGSPTAVSRKQKANSKALQYEGYKGRR